MSPETCGVAFWVVILLTLAVWRVGRALNSETRSVRFANWSIAAGLVLFAGFGTIPAFPPDDRTLAGYLAGTLAVVCSPLAVLFGVRALVARKHDRGSHLGGPILGLVLGVFGVCPGCGAFLLPAINSVGGTPWTYKSATHGLEVTLPSNRWASSPRPGAVEHFYCSSPEMLASVTEVRPATTEAEFENVIEFLNKIRRNEARVDEKERRGVNAHGHPVWVFTGEEKGTRPTFVGASVTWRNKKEAVILFFEGHYRMRSQLGHGQEQTGFRAASELILDSVR